MRKCLIVLALVVAFGLAKPPTAEATAGGPIGLVLLIPPVATAFLLFGTVDIIYAADASWVPTGWAIAEIASGTILGGLGALTIAAGSDNAAIVGIGAGVAGLGGLLLAHGIISAIAYEDPNDLRIYPVANLDHERWQLGLGLRF